MKLWRWEVKVFPGKEGIKRLLTKPLGGAWDIPESGDHTSFLFGPLSQYK